MQPILNSEPKFFYYFEKAKNNTERDTCGLLEFSSLGKYLSGTFASSNEPARMSYLATQMKEKKAVEVSFEKIMKMIEQSRLLPLEK